MKSLIFLLLLVSAVVSAIVSAIVSASVSTTEIETPKVAIAIHGGAGTLVKENMTPQLEQVYDKKLREALRAGYAVLTEGGSSVAAVQAAIVVMEDSPLFNAGKGAVFTHSQVNELDASIMEGKTLNAGSVSGVRRVKNPIKLAHAVMEQSVHVMLTGEQAEVFAKEQGVELVEPKYFYTERRWDQLQRILDINKISEQEQTDHDLPKKAFPNQKFPNPEVSNPEGRNTKKRVWPDDKKFGTVGAVALDQQGNLAAATSTGGMANKKYGRVGDSPIIGAGTYADNNACAISATGHGEFFIRAAVAHDICARVLYKKVSLQQAADEVIQEKLVRMKGSGGIIGLSPLGKPVFSFNSAGMYRGYIDTTGKIYVGIYKN